MIEAKIHSIRMSLVTQHRVVILKEVNAERYLPIWIGAYEADAIAVELQDVSVSRPLTHDLLKAVIGEPGATVQSILINDLHDDTFFARNIIDVSGEKPERSKAEDEKLSVFRDFINSLDMDDLGKPNPNDE